MPRKRQTSARTAFPYLDTRPTASLTLFAAQRLLIELHQLPILPRHFRRDLPPGERRLPLSAFPREMRDALHVIRTLVEKGAVEARRDFNTLFASRKVNLPLFVPATGALWWSTKKRPHSHPGLGDGTVFHPALSLWFLLFDPDAYERLRQCPECNLYFWDPTRNLSKQRCSRRCTHRATSRAARAAGTERAYRSRHRVTVKE